MTDRNPFETVKRKRRFERFMSWSCLLLAGFFAVMGVAGEPFDSPILGTNWDFFCAWITAFTGWSAAAARRGA